VIAAERHGRIMEALRAAPFVQSEQLAASLGVSLETIRRDLGRLEDQGQLTRVRGGAGRIKLTSAEADHAERSQLALPEKSAMAAAAVALLRPGMTVVIDVGTSCSLVARTIPLDWTGRIVTCSLPAALALADHPGVEVLLTGGRLRPGDLALSNTQTVSFFRDVHSDLAFLGSGGLHARTGLTDYWVDEIQARRVMLENASRCYVLADSSKHGQIAPFSVCRLNELTGVITDRVQDRALAAALRRAGVRVITSRTRS
jgi:DeoR/GlpR family transcriptional regulator of sugar metabolism